MRVIISAGGTGGHIYPALSIIDKIKEKEPDSEFLYIGTKDRMESEIVPKLGIPYVGLNVIGIKKNLSILRFVPLLNRAISKCKKIIKEFNPDIVIGVGGYITAPVIFTAKRLGYKTIIHEQNSIPGKSNTWLCRYADKVMVSLPGSINYFKHDNVVLTGNPRCEEAFYAKKVDKTKYKLSKNKKLVLIVMGSLGSESISSSLIGIIPQFKDKNYEVMIITGKDKFDMFPKDNPSNVFIVPYMDKMVDFLKNVDVLVTRAGASTIAEILGASIPSILVPSPFVANNHQYYNAKELLDNGAALLLEEKDFNEENLLKKIDLLLTNSVLYKEMQENTKKIGVINSKEKIYQEIKNILGG